MNEIEKHYNKFSEEKRLNSRHGQVEFRITMEYIHRYLKEFEKPKILDIGAGTGRYSVALANEGYDVTAVELVKYNLGILKQKNSNVKAMQGNALNLKKLQDNSFDVTLLFGPMYHLFNMEDKVRALQEARRVTRPEGVIMVAYLMNEYSVLTYGFREGHMKESIEEGRISKDFKVSSQEKDLYDYVRIEDINQINEKAEVERIQIITPDGPADMMRPELRTMDEETFELFVQYVMCISNRQEILGASAHTVDILRVTK